MSKSRFGLAVAVAMAAGALGAGIPGQSANSERVMRALDKLEVTRRHAVRIEAKNGGLLAVELTEMLGRHIQ